jgi:iodotyrosine deiodinase
MSELRFVPLEVERLSAAAREKRGRTFEATMLRRRTVRDFSNRPVPRKLIERALRIATSGPSAQNLQPWVYVIVSNKALKRKLRLAAEEDAKRLIAIRGPRVQRAMASFGSEVQKRQFEIAPWLIVVFAKQVRRPRTYVPHGVGMSCGLFIAALQQMGLGTLVHRASPEGFLNEMCGRPDDERPFAIIVVGYPARGCLVPVLPRRPFGDMAIFVE